MCVRGRSRKAEPDLFRGDLRDAIESTGKPGPVGRCSLCSGLFEDVDGSGLLTLFRPR